MIRAYIVDQDLVSKIKRPLFVLDSGLNCVYSEGFLPLHEGQNLNEILEAPIVLSEEGEHRVETTISGARCFVDALSIKLMDGSDGYACRFEYLEDIERLALRTGMGRDISSFFQSAQKYVEEIDLAIGAGKSEGIAQGGLVSLAALMENGKAWLRGYTESDKRVTLDFCELCGWLVGRGNGALVGSGKTVNFVGEPVYINCNQGMAMAAMSNVMRNSIMCGGEHTNVTLSGDDTNVCLKVENKGEGVHAMERGGAGWAVFESFVRDCGGTYRINEAEYGVELEIELPRQPESASNLHLAQGFTTSDYSDDDLRLVESVLQELSLYARAQEKDS